MKFVGRDSTGFCDIFSLIHFDICHLDCRSTLVEFVMQLFRIWVMDVTLIDAFKINSWRFQSLKLFNVDLGRWISFIQMAYDEVALYLLYNFQINLQISWCCLTFASINELFLLTSVRCVSNSDCDQNWAATIGWCV